MGDSQDKQECDNSSKEKTLEKEQFGGISGDMSEEQIYTISLRRTKSVPRWKRSNRAITEVKIFLSRHTKAEEIKLDPSISEKIWEKGAKKPPSKIRVKVTKTEDSALEAKLAEGKEFMT